MAIIMMMTMVMVIVRTRLKGQCEDDRGCDDDENEPLIGVDCACQPADYYGEMTRVKVFPRCQGVTVPAACRGRGRTSRWLPLQPRGSH